MVKLPEPPPARELVETRPDWITIPEGTKLWRIHRQGGEHTGSWHGFRHLGPLDARFDHHLPPPREQARGIYHAAREWRTCVAEVFQVERRIDAQAASPALVAFRLARPVKLLDLTGSWPTRAGASMAIHAARRDRARSWSRAVYQAFPGAEGLLCCSSMNANRTTIPLYERAKAAVPVHPIFHRPLSDPQVLAMLEQAAAEFGYQIG